MEDLKFSNVCTFGKLLKKKVKPNFFKIRSCPQGTISALLLDSPSQEAPVWIPNKGKKHYYIIFYFSACTRNLLTAVIMMSDRTDNTSAHWQELDEWRKKIDALDQQLSTLLCERLHCAQNISFLKSRIGEQVLQPEREKEVLINVLNQADSPLKTHALEKIYRCIIEETRLFQQEWKSSQPDIYTS